MLSWINYNFRQTSNSFFSKRHKVNRILKIYGHYQTYIFVLWRWCYMLLMRVNCYISIVREFIPIKRVACEKKCVKRYNTVYIYVAIVGVKFPWTSCRVQRNHGDFASLVPKFSLVSLHKWKNVDWYYSWKENLRTGIRCHATSRWHENKIL